MLSRRFFRVAVLLGAAAAVTTGCPECAPDRVAVGVAQLTVRNVGAMVSLVNADSTCGFASDAVLGAAVADGAVGSEGTLTFTVTDCVIDLGSSPVEVSSDCNDNTTTATGKITVSATREIGGILTGDATNPIVPGGPDSVTITLTKATFVNFEVKSSSSESFLTMIEGSLGATVKPRLAVDVDQKACSVATPNVTFTGIAYDPSTLHVTAPGSSFDVGVATSNLSAQNGKGPDDDENTVAGDLTVFDSPQVLAAQALDPEFEAAVFASNYTCETSGLFLDADGVESYQCPNLNPLLADGAARLTVKMLGTVAGLIDADTACGFSSEAVQTAGVVDGTPGGEGSLTLTVTDCEIAFAALTELDADCNGDATTVNGTITVSGTKTVSGRFTGNPASPIVPITDQPAAIALTIVTDDFSVGSTADVNTLVARSGTLVGTVRPKVFIGADTGVCSVSSPNAGFDDITWADADLLLTSVSGSFALAVDSASLAAANGTSASGTNELNGTVTIDGEALTVPGDGAGLNPEFSQADLDDSFTCDPALAQPLSDACEATLDATIAPGIAALTARTFGTVVGLIDADSTCGFSSIPVAVVGATFVGDVGDPGATATFTIGAACTVALPTTGVVVSTDCLGNTTTVSGNVSVTGTKTVTGWRTGDVAEPIVPDNSTPATFDLTLTFDVNNPFTVTSSTSTAALTVRGGTLDGVVEPRVAIDPATGACSIATPNVTFTDLTWTDAPVTLVSDGNAFTETVATSDIDAQNGDAGAGDAANTIAGSITIDGTETTVAGPLDPEFDQAAFDSTYQCAANGSPVLVPTAACSFRQALGNGAAALLVKAAATAVSVHDKNTICGFAADASPTPAPTGTPPAPGTLTFDSAAGCQSGFVADTTIATDCVGDETHAAGGFATTAISTKVVQGLFTGVANPSFVPTARDSAVLTLPGITFAGWTVAATDSADVVDSSVTITSGTASVVVNPITGRNAGASQAVGTNVFTESTGIASIESLVADDVVMTIVSSGKTFNLTLTDVDLDAFAGAFFDGTSVVGSNDLAGTLTVDGEPVTIAAGTALNPDYDQVAFDATYTCNPVLGDPPDVVPSAAP